jgi:GT2 family glycosyltransferase
LTEGGSLPVPPPPRVRAARSARSARQELESLTLRYEALEAAFASEILTKAGEWIAERQHHERLSQLLAARDHRLATLLPLRDEVERLENLVASLVAQLEQSAEINAGLERDLASAGAMLDRLATELEAIRATRTFRAASLGRRAYGWLRRGPHRAAAPELVSAVAEGGTAAGEGEPTGEAMEPYRAVDHAASPGGAPQASSPPEPEPAGEPPKPEPEPAGEPIMEVPVDYAHFVECFATLTASERDVLADRLASLAELVLISLVLVCAAPPNGDLRAVVDSVRAQSYPYFELLIVPATPEDVPSIEALLPEDHRVRCGGAAPRGRFVGVLDEHVLLEQDALAFCVLEAAARPQARCIFTDEDRIDAAGRRSDPRFKPEFDPLLLLAGDYFGHLTLIHQELVRSAPITSDDHDPAARWARLLALTGQLSSAEVARVPRVLAHRRIGTALAADPATPGSSPGDRRRSVLEAHLAEVAPGAEIELIGADPGWFRVRFSCPEPPPSVTIVVPTRDGRHLRACLQSVRERTEYPSVELCVVDNGSVEPSTAALLAALGEGATVLRDDRPFNYSALNNLAARTVSSEVLCLMNDDVEVLDPGWLTEMVAQLMRPGVGLVGAKLDYPDGTLQHAGLTLGIWSAASHAFRGAPPGTLGDGGRLAVAHEVAAVTGACLAVRRSLYLELGGLDEEHLPISYNDVDLCMRARRAGYKVVWTPGAELVHHEGASRGAGELTDQGLAEEAWFRRTWGAAIEHDPFYNPNLSLLRPDFSLASGPRVRRPAAGLRWS